MVLPRRLRTLTATAVRREMREVLDSLNSDGPVVLTSREGEHRGVLLSVADYDKIVAALERQDTAERLRRAEEEIEEGKLVDAQGMGSRALVRATKE